jgi:hypothetical protein
MWWGFHEKVNTWESRGIGGIDWEGHKGIFLGEVIFHIITW